MVTDELSRMMNGLEGPGAGPDLDRVRRLGRRRRRARRGALLGVSAAGLAAVTGSALLIGGGGAQPVQPAAQPDPKPTLTSYEKRVLREVPGSYAVDGTVVVPGAVDPTSKDFSPVTVVGPVVDLGFHSFPSTRYVPTKQTYPAFLDNADGHDIIRVDAGEVSLACVTQKGDTGPCSPAVMAHLPDGSPYFLYGLGRNETFMKPGQDMQVFTATDDSNRTSPVYTAIGGFDGTAATRVVLQLADGSETDAHLDRGQLSKGDTLFWAGTPEPVTAVRAYDASGKLVESHLVRACTGGVDCESR